MQAEVGQKIVAFSMENEDILGEVSDFELVHHYPDRYFDIDTTAVITRHPSRVQFFASFVMSVSPPNYRIDRLSDGKFAVY